MITDLKEIPESDLTWIEKYNASNMVASKYNLYDNENMTSIIINYPALLLRKKS